MKSILYLTDFAYEARGRRYCDEDIMVADYLRDRFHVATCHPACCEPFEDAADLVVFRNAGPVARRVEAVQVVLVKKGDKAPAASYGGARQAFSRPYRKGGPRVK